ncbi:MAG: hypothetical protein D6741_08195 [Planctomycetota bacterium]|nr:MAG: hypothetical protein D6741_08195 [Planctomycetota bacterium]
MFGLRLRRFEDNTRKVKKKAQDATFRNLGHAGAAVRLTAKRSIRYRKRKKASPVGNPPFTHTKRLPRAIVYAVDKWKTTVVVGPSASLVGPAGLPHEHGGRFRGQRYRARPFMKPALRKNLKRLPRFWKSSVK